MKVVVDDAGADVEGKVPGNCYFLEPSMWRRMLRTLEPLSAMELDLLFGAHQHDWIVRTCLSQIPNSADWERATACRSFGMMMYLLEYGVPCPDLPHLVQYATDEDMFKMLIFFSSPDMGFKDTMGAPLDVTIAPLLDMACMRGHARTVFYVKRRWPGQLHSMLKNGVRTLSTLVERGRMDVVRMVVPSLARFSSWSNIYHAVKRNDRRMVEFALRHLDEHSIDIRQMHPKIMNTAAKYNYKKMLFMLSRRTGVSIPASALSMAFSYGHSALCRKIQEKYPLHKLKANDILMACAHGHANVIRSLDAAVKLPDECVLRAVTSGNASLMGILLDKKPDFAITEQLFMKAVESSKVNDVNMCLLLFDRGLMRSLPVGAAERMTARRMRRCLRAFHQLGLEVYTDKVLIEAARICEVGIVRDVFEVGKLRPLATTLENAKRLVLICPEARSVQQEAFTYLDIRRSRDERRPERAQAT